MKQHLNTELQAHASILSSLCEKAGTSVKEVMANHMRGKEVPEHIWREVLIIDSLKKVWNNTHHEDSEFPRKQISLVVDGFKQWASDHAVEIASFRDQVIKHTPPEVIQDAVISSLYSQLMALFIIKDLHENGTSGITGITEQPTEEDCTEPPPEAA